MSDTPHIILDAHLDLAMNALIGRNFLHHPWHTRRLENKFPGAPYDEWGVATVGLPDLLLGRTGIVFGTIWVMPPSQPFHPLLSYETPQQAYQQALRQLDFYNKLADSNPRVRLIRYQKELDEVLASWGEGTEFKDHLLGIVLLMEGADPILEPAQVDEWYERGLRVIGPAWQGTRYSGGTDQPGRLTRLGHQLLEQMSDYNMILDLSHIAEEAFYEAIDIYPGPMLATHTNPRRFVNTDRHFSDAMIRLLMERDGTMGVILYNAFMQQGWDRKHSRKSDVTMANVLDIIDHICQVAGSARHVGIGSDWDGTLGWESIPAPFDTHSDLWKLGDHLRQRYEETDVRNILCGNFLRVLRKGLP